MNNDFVELTPEDIKHSISNMEQLVFEVTDACNLRCKYCAYGEMYNGYDERESKNLPFHKAKLIIDYLYCIWGKEYQEGFSTPLTVNFYGGEPLINMAFIKEVLAYLESLPFVGKTYVFGMTTNGMLLDRYMDFLAEKEFRLLISLDGNKDNQSYRVDHSGENSFDRVMANIELLRTKYPEYYGRNVRFNSVLHNRNSVESIYCFFKDFLGKVPNISGLSSDGIRKDKRDEFHKTYRNLQVSFDEAANCSAMELNTGNPKGKKLTEYIFFDSGNVFVNYNALLYDRDVMDSGYHNTGTCVPFSKKMFITVNGKILQCEKIDHDYALGYITDDDVILDLSEVANRQNNHTKKLTHVCPSCASFKQCSQCIYFVNDLRSDSPKCQSFCTVDQSEARLRQSLDYLDENPELYKQILRNTVLRS